MAPARTRRLGPAVDDAAAAEAGFVAALALVRVAGPHGEGAVAVVGGEVGRVPASADVAARTAFPRGGTAVAGVDCSVVHCSGGGEKRRSGGCGDVAVGDCW